MTSQTVEGETVNFVSGDFDAYTDEIQAYLDSTSALERRADTSAVKSIVSANGARLQSKAMRNAPIDTGALMRSIGLTLKDGGLTAEVQPAMEYAAYVEYGTRFMDAHLKGTKRYLPQCGH